MIQAEREYFIKECEDWNELIRKTVVANAKAQHWPLSLLKEVDQDCPKDTHPTMHKFYAQTGQRKMKDLRNSKPKEKSKESHGSNSFGTSSKKKEMAIRQEWFDPKKRSSSSKRQRQC